MFGHPAETSQRRNVNLDKLSFAAIAGLAASYWLILLFWNAPTARLDLLGSASGDDLAFFQVVLRMYDALWQLDARNFFNISFQSYGFVYFFVQLLIAAPAFALEAWDTAAFLLRMLPGFWGACTIILAAAIVRHHSVSPGAPLITACLVLSMPGFWMNGLWNHPDLMMVFFLTASFYWASRSGGSTSIRDLVTICALFALALSSKFQAIIAAPALGLYLAWPCLFHGAGSPTARIAATCRLAALCSVATLGFFVLFNPYLVHPLGLWAFVDDLTRNIDSNRTNHGAYTTLTLGEKFAVIGRDYFNLAAVVLMTLSVVISLAVKTRKHSVDARPLLSFAIFILITFAIMLSANKAWGHYYVSAFVFLCVALVIALPDPVRHGKFTYLAAVICLAAAAISSALRVPSVAGSENYAALNVPAVTRAAARLSRSLYRLVPENAVIAISPRTPLSLGRLHLRPSALRVISGPLHPDMLKGVTHLVIRKNDYYFDEALYADIAERDLPHRASMERARSLMQDMQRGIHPDFRPCATTPTTFVFCKSIKNKPINPIDKDQPRKQRSPF